MTGVNAYVFTSTGTYLSIYAQTDPSGNVSFELPAGNYKFRADFSGTQYWSAVETITADQTTNIGIDIQTAPHSFLDRPQRNPYNKQKVMVASLGSLEGIVASALITQIPGDEVYYYHNDHLGTPQKMTDFIGAVVWEVEYLPFGKATVDEDPDGDEENITSNLRFPGQYFDAETGLHYNWHRDYYPNIGRYIEADPIGLRGGDNIYAYVANSPTVNIDPFGLWYSGIHMDITRTAAREAGCDKAAQELAIATAGVDDLPGTNEPERAFWHAMVNGYNDAAGQAQDIRNYNDRVEQYSKSCKPEELGLALHAIQDSYAPAHRGFQPWYNRRRDYLSHISDLGGGDIRGQWKANTIVKGS